MPVAVTRCGNMYGGGDLNWSRIVPGTIRSVLEGEPPIIRSDGTFVRDYLHVDDAAGGVLLLADAVRDRADVRGEAFNFAGRDRLTVLEIVRRILALMEPTLEPTVLGLDLTEIREQRVSTAKAKRVLGWRPRVDPRDGPSRGDRLVPDAARRRDMTAIACRGCGAGELEVVLDLGAMPLANGLLAAGRTRPPRGALSAGAGVLSALLRWCRSRRPCRRRRCSASTPISRRCPTQMVEHARVSVDRRHRPTWARRATASSVEVASNDGYLLQHYVARGIPVLGIDPARNVAEAATARGIPTIAEFFGPDVADELQSLRPGCRRRPREQRPRPRPGHPRVRRGIATILKPDGVAVIETPYVRELVDRLEFDTIYHEHVFYYSLPSLAGCPGDHGLVVVDVERIPIHGGSLRVFAAHASRAP